jgi:uncharacterized protein (DUF305 family)
MEPRRWLLLAPLLLAALVLAACGGSDHGGARDAAVDAGSKRDADAMFAQMMIPHHEQAIVISDLARDPDRGASPDVVALAEQIRAAQAPEIEQMQAWLDAQGAVMGGDHSGHGGMDGMLSDEEIAALASAQGADFDRLFLEGMIAHHEGAVAMAEDVKADGDDPEMTALADEIIAAQEQEIAEMRVLLGG